MPIPNLFTDDLTDVEPADLQQAIVHLSKSGVEEKFRLDFKEEWKPDKQCPDVAAMANTYGGLLIVGVSDDRQRFPGTIPPTNSDLKTQIGSHIATRISPVPIFEVHTCPAPEGSPNLLVVIRITPQPRIHMCLKGETPVYVRNEDQTRPAKAAQLQALIDRATSATSTWSSKADPLSPAVGDIYVTKANNLADSYAARQNPANRNRSETSLWISIVPERPLQFELDVSLERRFKKLIDEHYPSIEQRRSVDLGSTIHEREDRSGQWFRFHHLDVARDHEMAWGLNSLGIVQCAFEVATRLNSDKAEVWSIADLFVNLNSTIRLAHELWSQNGYFGSAVLAARLQVAKLVPIITRNNYPPLFYDTPLLVPVSAAQKLYGNYEIPTASAETQLTYDGRTSSRARSLIAIGNPLLRDLRFGVDTADLRSALDQL